MPSFFVGVNGRITARVRGPTQKTYTGMYWPSTGQTQLDFILGRRCFKPFTCVQSACKVLSPASSRGAEGARIIPALHAASLVT